MLKYVIMFVIKVYVYSKAFDAIENAINKFKESRRKKVDNSDVIETYFVD